MEWMCLQLWLDDNSELGRDYLTGMKLAGRYAYAGREAVGRHVARQILRSEDSGRKCTTIITLPGRKNMAAKSSGLCARARRPPSLVSAVFVGGSMGDDAVIIEGVDSPLARGRSSRPFTVPDESCLAPQRKDAFEKWARKGSDAKGSGRHDEMMKWIADRGIELRGGDVDEAPQAYRRLPEVLAAHAGTIRILHTLKPLGVAMAAGVSPILTKIKAR